MTITIEKADIIWVVIAWIVGLFIGSVTVELFKDIREWIVEYYKNKKIYHGYDND